MKKIEVKPILISLCLIIFQSLIYLISKQIQGTPNIIGGVIDNKIPFIVYFIIPYVIWYLMLFIVPYILYKKDKNIFTKYILSYIIITIISNIIFIIYPTTVLRENLNGTNIFYIITKFIYQIDTPALNCFPSLHCGISMLWILFITNIKKANKIKISIIIISILIMLSTLFIKQHVFIDLISGNIIAILIYLFINKTNKLTTKTKELLKI